VPTLQHIRERRTSCSPHRCTVDIPYLKFTAGMHNMRSAGRRRHPKHFLWPGAIGSTAFGPPKNHLSKLIEYTKT